jgi:hypothetical protein
MFIVFTCPTCFERSLADKAKVDAKKWDCPHCEHKKTRKLQ